MREFQQYTLVYISIKEFLQYTYSTYVLMREFLQYMHIYISMIEYVSMRVYHYIRLIINEVIPALYI